MSELVLLHCGKNDFTTGPMPIRTAAAYIAEAVLDGMDCVGSHSVLEFQTVPADFVVPFPYVPELEPLYDLGTQAWDKTCPCILAEQRDPECEWHGRGVAPGVAAHGPGYGYPDRPIAPWETQ